MININNITRGCKTCIIDMLLQSDINKWRISQLAILDKLYINSTSTRLLQRPNNGFIQYKNQKIPNNSHINLRACDAASSYNFPSLITRSNIPKMGMYFELFFWFSKDEWSILESSEELHRLFPASLHKIRFHIF